MFSVYAAGGTDVFAQGEQDSVINAFYNSAANCDARPYIPRSSTDPLFRQKGNHCAQAAQQPGNNNNGNNGGPGSGLCSVTGSSTMVMKIMAPAGSSVECLYNGSPFSKPASFDSASGYWSCAEWTLGNPGYQLNVRVNGTDHLTNENTIRGVSCGSGNVANAGGQNALTGKVCATERAGKVYFQTAGIMSDNFSCYYSNGGSFSQFSSNSNYDSVKNRWSCAGWSKGNPSYQIKLILNGNEMLTDEADALSRPCP